MGELYTELTESVGRQVAAAMLDAETDWESGESPDRRVFRVLMRCGQVVMKAVLEALAVRFEGEGRALGYVGERRSIVEWMTLFGVVLVPSLYMRKKGERAGLRPMRVRLGVEGGGKSGAVERALTDFGIDESFGAAAAKFAEHYGTPVHRTTVRRVVMRAAGDAGAFIEEKLSSAGAAGEPQRVMVQADGANAPKVTLEAIPGEVTRTGRQKYKKVCSWREVRLGLAVADDADAPIFVAQVGGLARFSTTLALAAQKCGSDAAAVTYAVTDGGNGIRERLEEALDLDAYVLDMRHCRSHLLDTAEEMGLDEPNDKAHAWLSGLARGNVDDVIAELDEYQSDPEAPGADRARQLRNHLGRFHDAVHYQEFVDRGLMVGSGHVESGHRHVTQRRLKIAGAWWAEENMEPIVALRCIRANGWWEEYWRKAA